MEAKTLVSTHKASSKRYTYWIEVYIHITAERPYIDSEEYYSFRAWKTQLNSDIPSWTGTAAGFPTAAKAAFAAYEAIEQIKGNGKMETKVRV